jgi:prepilin-type processing-associated H-X9-DG protein
MRIANRIVSTLALLAVAVLAVQQPARADINKYIDDKTVIAARADLTKVDATALATFLRELATNAGMIGPNAVRPGGEAEFNAGMAMMVMWINQAKTAGVTEVYALGDAAGMEQGPPLIVMPVPDDKADAVAALIPVPPQRGRPNPRQPQVQTIAGVGVVFGTPGQVERFRAIKPAMRPEIDAALKAGGAAPIKLALAFDATIRGEMAKNVPPQIYGKPTTLVTKDFQWLSIQASVPPAASIKAVAQSTDANTAKQTAEMVNAMLADAEKWNKAPGAFTKAIVPTVVNNQVVAQVDAKQIGAFATAMREPLGRARQVALRVQSASNLRQLTMVCLMHANENKGQWPADMKEVEAAAAKFAGKVGPRGPQILTNPQRPEVKPAYVYVKPPAKNADPQTVVLYESHKEFGEGVNVAFYDGHVEWIGKKEQFEQLLAKQAQ